jgi:hypothetical protein
VRGADVLLNMTCIIHRFVALPCPKRGVIGNRDWRQNEEASKPIVGCQRFDTQ